MNSSGEYLPTKWTRTTVADGDWLHANTIKPLSSRDDYLADKIDELSGNTDEKLNEEIRARIAGDTYLSGAIVSISSDFYPFSANVETSAAELNNKIDTVYNETKTASGILNSKITQTNTRIDNLEAATDVIAVFGTYEEFTAASASTWQQTVTDNDFIKVIRDDNYQPNTNDSDYQTTDDDVYQVYYEYHKTNHDGWIGWSAIGSLDPYYSVSEIDDKERTLSATIANNYLSANGTDISAGKNLDVVIQSNNPRVAFKTKDNVSFESVSATTFSGNTIKGETKTSTIDGLITSAEEGNKAANGKTEIEIYYNDNDTKKDSFEISSYGDTFSFYVSAQPSSPTWMQFTTGDFNTPGYPHAVVLSADKNLCQNWLNFDSKMYKSDFENWSASQNSTFNGSARLAGSADLANSASIASNTQDKLTAYYKEGNTNKTGTFNVSSLALSAGKGINFVSGANQLSISSEGTTYTTGQYIDISNDNKISVTGTLINSAQSGQSAYNWITTQSATLSAGFGIQFTSAGQNTMGIKLNAVLNDDDKIVSIGGKELVGGDDYIPYSAVEVKTMGTDKCVGSLASGSNVLKIAASYAYNDENGDRIDTNYVKISAMGNYVSANPYGIAISSTNAVKLVFTPTLPTPLEDNTYYIV